MKKLNTLKTFEDACSIEGLHAVNVLPDLSSLPEQDRKAIAAHIKLVIIARAANRLANEGAEWKPDWDNKKWDKYYPWFWMNAGSSGFRRRLRLLGFVFVCRLSPLLQIKRGSRVCCKSIHRFVYGLFCNVKPKGCVMIERVLPGFSSASAIIGFRIRMSALTYATNIIITGLAAGQKITSKKSKALVP